MAAFACWSPARNSDREPIPCFARSRPKRWGLPYEDVGIAQPDTQEVPNSGPTVASRTVMVVGKLVQSAAIGIRQTLAASGMLGAIVFTRRVSFRVPRVCRGAWHIP